MRSPIAAMSISAVRVLVCLAGLVGGTAPHAADPPAAEQTTPPSRFLDADGWFDVSKFLDTAYGFVPMIAPITEPAVGYGAAGALIFIDRDVGSRPRCFKICRTRRSPPLSSPRPSA